MKRTSRRLRVRFGLFATSHPLLTDTSIEALPSLLPPRHYCDITGLDVRVARAVSFCDLLNMNRPRTDPRTGLRYHDKNVYDLIKNLVRFLSPRVSRP